RDWRSIWNRWTGWIGRRGKSYGWTEGCGQHQHKWGDNHVMTLGMRASTLISRPHGETEDVNDFHTTFNTRCLVMSALSSDHLPSHETSMRRCFESASRPLACSVRTNLHP